MYGHSCAPQPIAIPTTNQPIAPPNECAAVRPFTATFSTDRFGFTIAVASQGAQQCPLPYVPYPIAWSNVAGNPDKCSGSIDLVKYDPTRHHRQSIRLKNYDYASSGAYFITLCTHQRQCLFGEIVAGEMQLNLFGEIVAEEWQRTPEIRPNFAIDCWIVMPNHFHGIVIIDQDDRSPSCQRTHDGMPLRNQLQRKPRSLSSFVAGFKSITTKRMNTIRNATGTPVWQRNYYEHIIRDQDSAARIRQYIQNNPIVWEQDQLRSNNHFIP